MILATFLEVNCRIPFIEKLENSRDKMKQAFSGFSDNLNSIGIHRDCSYTKINK